MTTKKINTEGLDRIFSFGSKAVIIIPIVIVLLSLLFKFGRTSNPSSNRQLVTPAVTVSPANKLNIDFNGPLVCRYKDNNQEYDLFVKNRKVTLEIKAGGLTKKYDLSSYLSLVEGMINGGSTNLDSLASQYLGKNVSFEELLKTCKKEDF